MDFEDHLEVIMNTPGYESLVIIEWNITSAIVDYWISGEKFTKAYREAADKTWSEVPIW